MTGVSEKSIFLHAIELTDLDHRDRYLDDACGDNMLLRQSVQALLEAENESNLLDRPPVQVARTDSAVSPETQWIGKTFGKYRLMEQIGEGGFGLVFVAQQDHPIQRQVAIKVVKPGMGTKEVLARFEAERQAVAMMDHPNIARIFDAGVTEDGRPYFAMELVRGVSLIEFADAHRRTIRERIDLFIDVCLAVHHAHQKAVINRDLKTSNVLVTLHDDRAVVKVIDFGIAKAIGQSLTDKTIYTRFFAMMGTPAYMSPEQAEMSGLDVDTRSDIYSLGVLLYELLTGATPFDRDRLDSAGLDELRRIIREEDPPSPSKRLSTLQGRASTVSELRRLDESRLSSTLRGDLDWIVMKSLEKDRNRRYDSAMALADDLRRFLQQEPIEARPPSTTYRITKYATRYRFVLASALLVLLSLAGGLLASLWQMRLVAQQRDQKEAALQELERFASRVTRANELVASGESLARGSQLELAEQAFDDAVSQQRSYDLPWVSRGQFLARQYRWSTAAADFAEALRQGASIGSPPWWGVPSLLSLMEQSDALEQFYQRYQTRLSTINDTTATTTIHWEWIRNGVVQPEAMSREQYQRLAAFAERKLQADQSADDPRRFGDWQGPPDPLRDGRRPPPPNSFQSHEFGRRPEFGAPPSFDGPRNYDGPPNRGGPPRYGRQSYDGQTPRGQQRFDQDRPPRRSPPKDENGRLPRPVQFHITGLAHLRANDIERAIACFRDSQREYWPSDFLADASLALAYVMDGNTESAQRFLERAEKASERFETVLQQGDPVSNMPWFDLVELEVLLRETNAKLKTADN
ncbi:MAG: protein kinase [Planctomycetota bacterium]